MADEENINCRNCSDSFCFKNRYQYPLTVEESNFAINESRQDYFNLLEKNISELQKIPNRAKRMAYFDKAAQDQKAREEEIKAHKLKGGKVIGTFCVQVPEEIIYAAGAIPIRLSNGFYDAIPLAEEIVPKNICNLVKASIGFPYLHINELNDLCDAIVIPTTCDAKKKMADVLSNIKTVFTLELPHDRDHQDAMENWQGHIAVFAKKVEKLTGNRITNKSLKEATELLQERTRLSRRFMEIRKAEKIVINGRDAMLVYNTAFFDDIHRWMENVKALCDELEENIKNGKTILPDDTPRIMLTGSPTIWPNFKVLSIIEEQDAVVAIDDSCAGTQYFYNPPEVADWSYNSMINAIANKHLLPTICPVFVHNDDRVDRVLELADQYRIEGVIYHILRLCQVMDFDYDKVKHVLQEHGKPVLRMETEYGEQDAGQLRTRVEAFIEMIRARRT